eukprot:gb/GECG01001081.1/.p1 GENE.gb/GECG01001081.1/~~gb/GECG01001081.1/.p1  ORF type:complete len:104 (+),score=5.11 gb/GECG01001081.1/:1-312(+)
MHVVNNPKRMEKMNVISMNPVTALKRVSNQELVFTMMRYVEVVGPTYSTANSATGTATNAVVCSSNHNEAHKSAQKGSIHYKQDKILLIRQTHAVIYPGTVMI